MFGCGMGEKNEGKNDTECRERTAEMQAVKRCHAPLRPASPPRSRHKRPSWEHATQKKIERKKGKKERERRWRGEDNGRCNARGGRRWRRRRGREDDRRRKEGNNEIIEQEGTGRMRGGVDKNQKGRWLRTRGGRRGGARSDADKRRGRGGRKGTYQARMKWEGNIERDGVGRRDFGASPARRAVG